MQYIIYKVITSFLEIKTSLKKIVQVYNKYMKSWLIFKTRPSFAFEGQANSAYSEEGTWVRRSTGNMLSRVDLCCQVVEVDGYIIYK